jgi:enoyl-[acyl-carrier protein] reductase I
VKIWKEVGLELKRPDGAFLLPDDAILDPVYAHLVSRRKPLLAHLAEPLMQKGGTLFTMTYYGSQMVVKNYNIMGVAKAALESAVRYMAAELGPKGIRVHAISPGPLATRAASGIPEFDELLEKAKTKAPARSLVSIDDVGIATAFLAHDAAKLMTGDTVYIDGGYHIID